jgi:hypothetical protein
MLTRFLSVVYAVSSMLSVIMLNVVVPMKVKDCDKHANLLQCRINYGRNFFTVQTLGQRQREEGE